jgi:hypothetical protein
MCGTVPEESAGTRQNVSRHDRIVFRWGGESIPISVTTAVENPTKMDDLPEGRIDREGLDGTPPSDPPYTW